MSDETLSSADLRKWLNKVLSDEELNDLCFDHFRAVYDQFSTGMSHGEKLRRLIEHCERRGLVGELVNVVSESVGQPPPVAPSGVPGPAVAPPSLPEPDAELAGSRIIQIGVSQMFRIADLLTRPESVKAKDFYEAITNADKLRRALNRRKAFSLGTLGSLRPVIAGSDKYDRFWSPALPDLRLATSQPLCFIPFQLTLSQQLQNLRYVPGSVLESALQGTMEGIQNTQLSGRLRIYPPGIGVIQLGITLAFKEAIHIKVVGQTARNIEELLFVDSDGLEKPFEDLFLEIVDQVIEHLFVGEGFPYEERLWRPPETTLSIRDDHGLAPQGKINELAHLIAQAPANQEDIASLAERIQKAVESPQWQRDQVLAVAGQGVALFFIAASFAAGRRKKREELLEWLTETREVVSAAAYAQQAFAEKIESIAGPRLLDDTWLPGSENFAYLAGLLSTMRQVMRAIASIKFHLQKQGTGALMAFARSLWTYDNPLNTPALYNGLDYIAEWLASSQAVAADGRIESLAEVVRDIQRISPPFSA